MSWLLLTFGPKILSLVGGVLALAAAFFGFRYKYRQEGKAIQKVKDDKELTDALDDLKDDAQDARDAGDRVTDSKLRDDDGFRRD